MRRGEPLVIALSIGNFPSLTPRARFPWQVQKWAMALETAAAPMGLYFDRERKSVHAPPRAIPPHPSPECHAF